MLGASGTCCPWASRHILLSLGMRHRFLFLGQQARFWSCPAAAVGPQSLPCTAAEKDTTAKLLHASALHDGCRWGRRSWKPWLLSLSIDLLSMRLSSIGATASQARCCAGGWRGELGGWGGSGSDPTHHPVTMAVIGQALVSWPWKSAGCFICLLAEQLSALHNCRAPPGSAPSSPQTWAPAWCCCAACSRPGTRPACTYLLGGCLLAACLPVQRASCIPAPLHGDA